MTNYLLGCDWGTSSFRLQLIDVSADQRVGELISPEGVAGTFDAWRRTGRANGRAKTDFFRQQLHQHVKALAQTLSMDLTGVPITISGMASSSIGMEEVPYATLPFAVDGSQASVRHGAAQPDFPHETLLIGGVRSEQDVMRGEETQLIGLLALLDASGDKTSRANRSRTNSAVPRRDRSIFIFPGTHSKHMTIETSDLTHFDTYMTGELFDLLARQSILHDSVETESATGFTEGDRAAFRRGVRQSTAGPVLNRLFTVRTNGLFGKLTKPQNALYLSGLLIGSELAYLRDKPDWPVVLCSGRKLSGLYQLALDELRLSARTEVVPPDLVDRAAGVGQVQLYRHQPVKSTTA